MDRRIGEKEGGVVSLLITPLSLSLSLYCPEQGADSHWNMTPIIVTVELVLSASDSALAPLDPIELLRRSKMAKVELAMTMENIFSGAYVADSLP